EKTPAAPVGMVSPHRPHDDCAKAHLRNTPDGFRVVFCSPPDQRRSQSPARPISGETFGGHSEEKSMANRDLAPSRGTRLAPYGRDPFMAVRHQMDRLFAEFFAPTEFRNFGMQALGGGVWPSLDMNETDQAYTVTAELPGLEAKDVQIDLHDN